VSSANGMLCVGSSALAGCHGDCDEWPVYVVVYVQSYDFVVTFAGIGSSDD
jgi:hypothetical protein